MTEASSSTLRSNKAVTTVRDSASKALDATSNTARELARQTAEGIEANPVAVLAGGVALGVLVGAFMPRSEQEAKLLAPVGKRISETTRGAVEAAKDTAKAEFDVLGLTRNAARDQVGRLLGDVIKALSVAGVAAMATAKASAPTPTPAPTPSPVSPTMAKADAAA